MDNKIYHESQDSQLCGQHCLNNLLQETYFNSVDLAEIAQEIDKNERQLNNVPISQYSRKFESANVDESGNFSIQVLKIALSRFHGIELISWTGEEGREKMADPTQEIGFIINCRSHWYTIRNINNNWWNLDSLKTSPEYISPFYLTAFLAQLRAEGHSIFVVKGLSSNKSKAHASLDKSQLNNSVWYSEKALLSMSGMNTQDVKVQPFSGKGMRLGGTGVATSTNDYIGDFDDEEIMLAKAIELSRQEALGHNTHSGRSNGPGDIAIDGKGNEREEMRKKRIAALEKRGL